MQPIVQNQHRRWIISHVGFSLRALFSAAFSSLPVNNLDGLQGREACYSGSFFGYCDIFKTHLVVDFSDHGSVTVSFSRNSVPIIVLVDIRLGTIIHFS